MCVGSGTFAQQEWMHSHHAFNLYDVNSAFAGSYDELSAAVRIRRQWTGVDGAPASNLISLHSPIATRFSGGVGVLQEVLGIRRRLRVRLTGAYRIPMESGQLSFAINGGVLRHELNSQALNLKDGVDDSIILSNKTVPVFDAAVFYQDARWYAGIEFLNLNQPNFYSSSRYQQVYHALLTGGYVFPITIDTAIKPTVLMRYVDGAPLNVEGSLNVLLSNVFWIGIGYRSNSSLLFLADWNVTKRFRIGYSYDQSIGVANGLGGSHEIFMGMNVQSNKPNFPSIRYFR